MLPPASTVPAEGNPLLQLGGLDLTVDLLGKSLQDQSMTAQVEEASPTAQVEVGADPSSSGPILRIQVRDKSESAALEVRDMLVAMAPTRLADLQNQIGVKGKNRVTTSVLVSDAVAEPTGRDKLVGALVGGALGLGFSALAIALVDNILIRRSRRKSSSSTIDGTTRATERPPREPHPAEPIEEADAAVNDRQALPQTASVGDTPTEQSQEQLQDDDEIAVSAALADESTPVAIHDDGSDTQAGGHATSNIDSLIGPESGVASSTPSVAPNGQAVAPPVSYDGQSQGAPSGDSAT